MTQEIIMDMVQIEMGEMFPYLLLLIGSLIFGVGVVAYNITKGTRGE